MDRMPPGGEKSVHVDDSGRSYLNRVELQNVCLAISHSNLFIPSTLHGSNFNSHDGGVNYEKLEKILTTAADVYISYCKGAQFDYYYNRHSFYVKQ